MPERLQTVGKALSIVDLLAAQGPQSLTEISDRTGLAKPVVHRALTTLREIRWVEQVPETRKYRLGIRVWEVGIHALQHEPLYAIAMPMLERLATQIRATVGLSVYERGEMLFVARVQFARQDPVVVRAGERAPAHSTSSGKVALAYSPELFEEVVQNGLSALTQETVTDASALLSELEEVRRCGYAVNRQGRALGSCGVAVPIFDHNGRFAASIYSAVQTERFSEEWAAQTAPQLMECASTVSLALGYRGGWGDPQGQG